MAIDYGHISTISLSGSSDHIPHIKKIVSCIADNAGLDSQQKTETEFTVIQACATVIDSISDNDASGRFNLRLSASDGRILADVQPHRN